MMAPEAAPMPAPRSVAVQDARGAINASARRVFFIILYLFTWGCLVHFRSNSAHQHQDDEDEKYEAQASRRAIAPAAAMPPAWQGADQQQNKNNDEDSTHGGPLLSLGKKILSCRD